ncbi:5848_t:CDS:1, partial [Cetraspora pellucida]
MVWDTSVRRIVIESSKFSISDSIVKLRLVVSSISDSKVEIELVMFSISS